MQKIRLEQSVDIFGPDIFGRRARLTVSPTDKAGWWWRYHPEGDHVLITPDLLQSKWRHTCLVYYSPKDRRSYHLQYPEHILSLKSLGLDGIELYSENGWLPYYGSPFGYWRHLQSSCVTTREQFSWVTPKSPVRIHYKDRNRWTEIQPQSRPQLRVDIIIEYPGLGKYNFHWTSEDEPGWLHARTQGWPPWWRHPLCLLSFFGWPHYKEIMWPHRDPRGWVRESFAWHRLADLNAILNIAHPTVLLAAHVISHCSGHHADVAAVQSIQSDLTPIKLPLRAASS